MQLEDGRFLMSAERYDKLLQVRKERFDTSSGLLSCVWLVLHKKWLNQNKDRYPGCPSVLQIAKFRSGICKFAGH